MEQVCIYCGEPIEMRIDTWAHVKDKTAWCYAGGSVNKYYPAEPSPPAPTAPVGQPEMGSNYVANKEARPTEVRFKNGRRVWIVQDEEGPYLEVSMMVPGEAWLRNAAESEDGAFIGIGMTPYNQEVLAIMQAKSAAPAANALPETDDKISDQRLKELTEAFDDIGTEDLMLDTCANTDGFEIADALRQLAAAQQEIAELKVEVERQCTINDETLAKRDKDAFDGGFEAGKDWANAELAALRQSYAELLGGKNG